VAETKYDQCVVPLSFAHPRGGPPLMHVDGRTLEGFNCSIIFAYAFKPGITGLSTKPHVHDYDEVLGLIGTNPENPHDLCGESEVFMSGEKHIIDKSVLIYIPAGVEHGPFRELRMDRPIIHIECRNSGKH
jgi:hypothetical protein